MKGCEISGQEIEIQVWVAEEHWQTVGRHVVGLDAVGQPPCCYCGRAGRMGWHESFLYPGATSIGAPRREECPVCLGPMECIGVLDAI